MTRPAPVTTTAGCDRVECTDLLSLCASLPDASVDMILADLPYGTTACSWDEIIPFEPMWAAFKRVIKPRGAIVLTASQPFTSKLVMSNLDMFRCEWIWEKTRPTGFLYVQQEPLKAHEQVLIFSQGEHAYFAQGVKPIKPLNNGRKNKKGSLHSGGKPKVDYFQVVGNWPRTILSFAAENGLHPTQKPVDLFRYLIRTYTQAGDTVLDPTCGSGTTALAARAEGRHYIVGDISPEYIAITRDRLRLPFEARAVKADNDVSDLPMFSAVLP